MGAGGAALAGHAAPRRMLLTTLPVEDLTPAETVVRYYPYRWRIERYHGVLKSGCPIEDLPRETFDRVDRALAVYRLVAWRLLWLTYGAREQSDQPCLTVLRPAEWAALYAAHTRRREPPPAPVDLRTAVRWMAQLGGFLGRRGDGEPGVKTLWRGYRCLEDLTVMWEIVHPPGSPLENPAFRSLRSPRFRKRGGCRLPGHPTPSDYPRTPCAPLLSRRSRFAGWGHPPGSSFLQRQLWVMHRALAVGRFRPNCW